MLITGTPGPRVVGAMRTVAPITSSLTIVRVASGRQESLQGLRVLDVVGAEDLVAARRPADSSSRWQSPASLQR